MNIDDLNISINNVINDTQSRLSQTMYQNAALALGLVSQRVINKGVAADGSRFGNYSTKKMLIGYDSKGPSAKVYRKLASSKTKRAGLNWVTVKHAGKTIRLFELEGGYKQFRIHYGAQTSHVDFFLTGRMWNNIKVKSVVQSSDTITAIIGPSEISEQKKLEGNSDRFGKQILDLSIQEEQSIINNIKNDVVSLFKKYGL